MKRTNALSGLAALAAAVALALAFAACNTSSPSLADITLEGFADDPHVFPAANPGYGEQAPLTVTVRNAGDTETGALTAELSGNEAASFTLTGGALASIAANGTATFSVRPNTGLDPGPHSAVVTVSGSGIRQAQSFGVTFIVNDPGVETRTIAVGNVPGGTLAFDNILAGYEAAEITARTVEVLNTGNRPTGALSATLSGTGAAGFTVSAIVPESIPVGDVPATFSVTPVLGLSAGTHSATVTVAGAEIAQAQTFTVTITIDPATRTIGLTPSEPHVFDSIMEGYEEGDIVALTVEVRNLGDRPTGALTAVMTGGDSGAFTITGGSMASIPVGDAPATFTVIPNLDLIAGTYTATVMVAGMELAEPRMLAVSFTVDPLPHSIDLSEHGVYDFGVLVAGDVPTDSLTVTVTNTGDAPSGDLVVELSGDDEDSFVLSTATLTNIPAGDTSTFTVIPAGGLDARVHNATVTVRGVPGNNVPARYFDVTVRVRQRITEDFSDPIFLTIIRNVTGIEAPDDIFADDVEGITELVRNSNEQTALSIASLAGIGHLVNLEELEMRGNITLTEIDLSGNQKLTRLDLRNNRIANLDVSVLPNLEFLDAGHNTMQTVTLGTAANLEEVRLNHNNLVGIDVSGLPGIEVLVLNNNTTPGMGAVDLSGRQNLRQVVAGQAGLTSLNLEGAAALEELDVGNNTLTALDVSDSPALRIINVDVNSIAVLDLSGKVNIEVVQAGGANGPMALDLSASTALRIVNTTANARLASIVFPATLPFLENVNLSAGFGTGLLQSLSITDAPLLTAVSLAGQTNLTSLDLSNNPSLLGVTATNAVGLTSVNLTGSDAIATLNLSNNRIAAFVAPAGVTTLNLSGNQVLASLDLSAATVLTNLQVQNNALTSLNVSTNVALTELQAQNNQIAGAVSFANNPALWRVLVQSNYITSIDVRGSAIGFTPPMQFFVFVDFRTNSMTSVDDVIGWQDQDPPMNLGTNNFQFNPQRP